MYCPISYEDRITAILLTNYKYGEKIVNFLTKNPEFKPVAYLFPLDEKLKCFSKNTDPKNMFEFLLYYIAEAGVNANYGYKQWLLIQDYIRSNNDLSHLCDLKLQPKKVKVYQDLLSYLSNRKIDPSNLKLEDLVDLQKNVKGIGDGCLTFLYTLYDTSKITLPDYSEIGFKKGFQKFYQLDHRPTKSEVLNKSKTWSDIHLANVLMQQIYNYL